MNDDSKDNMGSKTKWVFYFTVGMVILTFILLIVGSIVYSFAFEFEGLAGYILPKD